MSDEKLLFKIKKDNEQSQIEETTTDMIFYDFNFRENFPISINYSNSNLYNINNNNYKLKNINEEENDDYEKKQNLNLLEFYELIRKKRNLPKDEKQENENLKKNCINKLSDQESIHSNFSSGININDSTKSNELIESNESIENLIFQFSSSQEPQIKHKIIKKLIALRKRLHKKKLENFYKIISFQLKESIEDVREWISFEERFNKIENLNSHIYKELGKYIKVYHSGKLNIENSSSKDFLSVHFIGSIKVKMIDFRTTLKSYK